MWLQLDASSWWWDIRDIQEEEDFFLVLDMDWRFLFCEEGLENG